MEAVEDHCAKTSADGRAVGGGGLGGVTNVSGMNPCRSDQIEVFCVFAECFVFKHKSRLRAWLHQMDRVIYQGRR